MMPMFQLPPATAIIKPLYTQAVFEKFKLKAVERDRFDADISRMALVARVSSATVPALTKGKEIEGFYVLQVALKRKDYDTNTRIHGLTINLQIFDSDSRFHSVSLKLLFFRAFFAFLKLKNVKYIVV